MTPVKKKSSLTLTDRQFTMLGRRARNLGLGISEYLRRLLDDPDVIATMDRMDTINEAAESPDDYLRRIAQGKA